MKGTSEFRRDERRNKEPPMLESVDRLLVEDLGAFGRPVSDAP